MLAVGRGLMASPRLLLLDEPSHGLAPLIIQDLIKIIERIRNTGIAILLVEQNMDMAYELSEYAYLLEAGRVALSGEKESLFQEEMVKKVYLGI